LKLLLRNAVLNGKADLEKIASRNFICALKGAEATAALMAKIPPSEARIEAPAP
jgi:hypothetical protein